jgi:hypothetical protein
MKTKLALLLLLSITLIIQTACSKHSEVDGTPVQYIPSDSASDSTTAPSIEQTSSEEITNANEIKIMKDFEALTSGQDIALSDVITYINEKITSVSVDNADIMVLRLEDLQSDKRLVLEEKFYPESIVKVFQNTDLAGVDYNKPDSFTDSAVKELVMETAASGYIIQQAEGFYFPVINYSIYKNYSDYVSADIKKYIEIMTVETDQVYAKDAGLMISWDEVIRRAFITEDFLLQYEYSKRAEAVKKLYDRYEFAAMFGLNNTPIFYYNTKLFNEEAKTAYKNILAENKSSYFFTVLKGFMEVVEKNGYKLTDEVEQYRKGNIGKLLLSSAVNPYYVAGIDDAKEFEKMYQLIQAAVSNNYKDIVAEYIAYPIKVSIDGTKTEIKNESEFVKNYDKIMTEEVKTALLNQNIKETFVNYKGVMVGQGEIWFNMIEGTKHKYSIYAINN